MSLLDSLKSASLLPSKVLPSTFTPIFSLNVTFPDLSPSSGSIARVSQVSTQPLISVAPISSSSNSDASNQSFTFMLIDPDAPTPADPKFGYWRHWIVSGIPGSSFATETDVTKAGTTLTPYLAPGPKDESGPHKYHFLLFQEPTGLKLSKSDVAGDEFVERRSFRVEEWVEKHGLEVVGVQWMRGVGDGWVEGNGEKTEL